MKCLLVCLALLGGLHLSTGKYYTHAVPCAGGQTVHQEEETVQVTGIEASTVFTVLDQVHLNTVVLAQTLPGALPDLQASLTSILEHYLITEVELVQETQPLTTTHISTSVTSIVKTEVDFATSTATNYVTEFETIEAASTVHVTVTTTDTQVSQLTITSYNTVLTTLTVTTATVLTEVVTESVPQTTFVATDTDTHTETSTDVHSLTKMITQFVCPPGLDHE